MLNIKGQVQTLPAAERLKILVNRQLNLKLNTPGHPNQVRAQMMKKNETILNEIFAAAWGS